MPVVQRVGAGRTQFDPLLLGEALPKINTVGLSYPHPKIHTAGTLLSLSHKPTHPQEPNTKQLATVP